MAKQKCKPYRSGDVCIGVAYGKPGVDIAAGDLLIQDGTNPHYVVPASEEVIANRAAAAAAFVGVAQKGCTGTQPERRVPFGYTGNYMYDLDAAADLVPGQGLTFDDDGVNLKAQGWKPTATAGEIIAVVTHATGHPDIQHNPTVIATASLDHKDQVEGALRSQVMA